MSRTIFDHDAPPGVSIEQVFASEIGFNGHPHWWTEFVAVCDACGTRSTKQSWRAGALEELEGHACVLEERRVAS